MRRLIVNADDFGRTPGVNEGTIEAHLRGIVTSATVMILERAAAEGIRQARRAAPRLSLGLHCVLTGGGPPASHRDALPTLAPSGRFVRNAGALPPVLDPGEIRRELAAQIALFEEAAGRPPTHLDSHHHAALHPAVEPVFAEVAAQRGLAVRASNDAAHAALRGRGLRVPDAFFDGFYAAGANPANLRAILSSLPEGTSELMCHPGHADRELLAGSSYAAERAQEVEILCDPKIRSWLRDEGVELVAFGAL